MIYGTDEFDALLLSVIRDDYRHLGYEKSCEIAKEASVHIYGDKPKELLERARPREDEEVRRYRLDNYEATTKGPAGKAVQIVSKIFNPINYSIVFPKTERGEELRDYTMYYFPVFNSLMAFNKEVLLKKMIADPNGLVAVKPQRIPSTDAEKIKPIVVLYSSENVWNYDLDHYLIFLKEEKVKNDVFYIFEYYDNQWYRKLRVNQDDTDSITIEELEEYEHSFKDKDGEGEIPVWFLRGNPMPLDGGVIVYESYFADAFPSWNLSVIHESDVLGAYITHMHPQKYEVTEDCGFKYPYEGGSYPCRGGRIRHPGRDNKTVEFDCPHCGGSGREAVKSPYGVYQFNKGKLDDMPAGLNPVGYIIVPTEATKMLEDRAKKLVKEGSSAINMDVENEVGENQSGVAKTIDRSGQYDMIYNISSTVFDVHVPNQFYFINKYKYAVESEAAKRNVDENLPQVNKPVNFNVLTIAEMLLNFKVGKESGLDRNFLQAKMTEILSRDLDTNPDMKRYYTSIINLDPLFGLDYDVIDSEVMKGTVRKLDSAIHFNLKAFVDRAIYENKNFLTLEKPEQIEILETYGQELIDSEKPKLDANMFAIPPDEEEEDDQNNAA